MARTNSKALEVEFVELLRRNLPKWAGIARAYAAENDRDDLLQEISLQVWKALPSFSGHSHQDTWAYRVALNTALAWERSTKTRREKIPLSETESAQIAGNPLSQHLEKQILDDFLQSLSKVDRALMVVYLDGMSNQEASEILGISNGAIRVRLHRLKKKFQELNLEQVESEP